ncbi:hypothetical protein [Streptomyces sp. NPDC050263]|uniref:hypothetical protein n=1 Tax=Streptomyces sp. NPDC050263 TaxID=3155037 RepID=UPI0034185EC7
MRLGVVVGILYCVQFSGELDDDEVARMTRMTFEQPLYGLTTEEQYEGIEAALAVDDWGDALAWQPHAEPAVRDFLRRILARLDAQRPWPEPPFRNLGHSRWREFRNGTLLAELRMYAAAQDPMHVRLRPVPGDEDRLRGVVLRLRSGDEVALVASPAPDGTDAVLMAVPPHRSAAEIVDAFVSCTGYERERVTPAHG